MTHKILLETRLRNLKRKYAKIIQHADLGEQAIELKAEIDGIEREIQNLQWCKKNNTHVNIICGSSSECEKNRCKKTLLKNLTYTEKFIIPILLRLTILS